MKNYNDMFKGIITPIVTPFHREDQTINYEATKDLINHLIKKGVSGIFILGSNGEFHVIDEAEKVAFAKYVVEAVDHRVPVFAGTGACATRESIRLSKQMEKVGVDALSIITPYFLKPTDEELYLYFKEIAESVNLPIVLYNIPKATGCNISAAVVRKLAKIENICAIKDSSGDEDTLLGFLEIAKEEAIDVLVGSDSKISFGYQHGATGAVAGTSNVITDVVVGLDKALNDGDTKLASEYQRDIDVIRKVLKYGTVPSVIKRSMELAGIAEAGPARKPVVEVGVETDAKIIEMLKYYKLK